MKLKVHIDTKGYMEKPTGKEVGRIKIRLQKNTSPSIVTVEELIQKIRTGHSISPGIMEGMSTKDWKEQQLFLVDIDNEENGPICGISKSSSSFPNWEDTHDAEIGEPSGFATTRSLS